MRKILGVDYAKISKLMSLFGILVIFVIIFDLVITRQIYLERQAVFLQADKFRALRLAQDIREEFGKLARGPAGPAGGGTGMATLNVLLDEMAQAAPAQAAVLRRHMGAPGRSATGAMSSPADQQAALVADTLESVIAGLLLETEALGQTALDRSRAALNISLAGILILVLVAVLVAILVSRIVAGLRSDIHARALLEKELRRHHDRLQGMVEESAAEVRDSRNQLLAAINAINDGFGLVDAGGCVTLANTKLKEFYPAIEEFISRRAHVSEVIRTLFPDLPGSGAASGKITEPAMAEHSLADGRWLRIQRSPLPDGGYIALYTDITTYKEQEQALEAQARRLREALDKERELNELQRQFVSMASHEFRTPLAIIDSVAQRISRRRAKITPDEIAERTTKIQRAVERMTQLMESTLAAARVDAGMLKIVPKDCDLGQLISDACLRQMELAPGYSVIADVKGFHGTTKADSVALEHVLSNLLSNAVKYSPLSKRIHTKLWRAAENVLFSVEDNGLGIDPDDLPRMFQRYFRARTSTGIAGTGIGLNLVKQIVEAHGGEVWVESAPGKGSRFTVRLPVDGPVSCSVESRVA